jgi:hypothetical protein
VTLVRAAEPPAEDGERWADVNWHDGYYVGYYAVSSHARAWSVLRTVEYLSHGRYPAVRRFGGYLLKQTTVKPGYHQVSLARDGRARPVRVHQLVMRAFVGACPPGQEVCHGPRKSPDGSVCDWADNLSYKPHEINNGPDRLRDGTLHFGEDNERASLTNGEAEETGKGRPC